MARRKPGTEPLAVAPVVAALARSLLCPLFFFTLLLFHPATRRRVRALMMMDRVSGGLCNKIAPYTAAAVAGGGDAAKPIPSPLSQTPWLSITPAPTHAPPS